MKTVLPARLNPVTPSLITGSENGAVSVSVTASTLRVIRSAIAEITNGAALMCNVCIKIGVVRPVV